MQSSEQSHADNQDTEAFEKQCVEVFAGGTLLGAKLPTKIRLFANFVKSSCLNLCQKIWGLLPPCHPSEAAEASNAQKSNSNSTTWSDSVLSQDT